MKDRGSRSRARAVGRLSIAALAGLLVCASVAYAVVGLQNPSFENGLDNWQVKADRDTGGSARSVVYGPGGSNGEAVPCDDSGYGVCVVGADTFEYANGSYDDIRTTTVEPLDGAKMLRLGGPFENNRIRQNLDRFAAEQTFTVDPENPVLEINRNVFTWDYTGFDEFEFRVTVTDESGEVVAREVAGSFGSGTDLKTTGWRPMTTDLSAYAGEQMVVRVSAGGTQDSAYPFWTYVDAGMVEEPPVGADEVEAEAPTLPGGGKVNVNTYADPSTGQTFITVPNSQVSQFEGGCMPLEIGVPIEPGAGTVSDVSLLFKGSTLPMTSAAGTNLWKATIDCVSNGDLFVEYTLTESGSSQVFSVPIGGLVLIDPQGVIYDQSEFDDAVAGGATPEQARTTAAIEGATATLQRETETEDVFQTVLSGDPGITPNVNPQVTGTDGLFQWDVSAGTYRVLIDAPGYVSKIGGPVDVPPPVTDMHVGLEEFETTITGGPGGSTIDSTPTFTFAANDPSGATFECAIDGGEFVPCNGEGSHTAAALPDGEHTFAVRGTDSHAFTDATPATRTVMITSQACADAQDAVADAQAALNAAKGAANAAQSQANAAKANAAAKDAAADAAESAAAKAQAGAEQAQAAADAAAEQAAEAAKKAKKAKGKAKKNAKAKAKAAKKKAAEAKAAAEAAAAAANKAAAAAKAARAQANAAQAQANQKGAAALAAAKVVTARQADLAAAKADVGESCSEAEIR